MNFVLNKYNCALPDEMLLDDLRRVAKLTKKRTVTRGDYIKHGNHPRCTIIRRFGGWSVALIAAGLETTFPPKPCKAGLFANILLLWNLLGRRPRAKDLKHKASRYTLEDYRFRFGSFKKAMEEFIRDANKQRKNKTSTPYPSHAKKKNRKCRKRRSSRAVSYKMRYLVLDRDQYACVKCGRSPANEKGVKLHIDHITPWSKGGETELTNLQTLCRECNVGKGVMP